VIVQIRRGITFYAMVTERPWNGERYRTPWVTSRTQAFAHARDGMCGGYLPIYLLRATTKPQQTQEITHGDRTT
jgi:hypothetical protein